VWSNQFNEFINNKGGAGDGDKPEALQLRAQLEI